MRMHHLLKGSIAYSVAKEREDNVLHQLQYCNAQASFFSHLKRNIAGIRRIVSHHLCLESPERCHVAGPDEWIHGSFNICILVTVDGYSHKDQPGSRVMMRFPLPCRVGEAFSPRNGDEKFTHIDQLTVFTKYIHKLRRYCVFQTNSCDIGVGYILIKYIEKSQGIMFSNTWLENNSSAELRANLFRGLSKILLSLDRIPLPRIGSFIINKNGYLRLENRPLTMKIQMLENEEIPTDISRDVTYSTVESYTANLLHIHDNRLQRQPNVVNDEDDCGIQMGTLAAMRALHHGPFIFSLTDLHQSNILVDQNWNITCLVDLEWACSRPIEMIETPYWLTGKGVDQINADKYNIPRCELMDILASQEAPNTDRAIPRLSEVLANTWASGKFWVTLAPSIPSALFTIFAKHIYPQFSSHGNPGHGALPFLWAKDAPRFVNKKVDEKVYDEKLQLAFEDPA
ncbi:hypothetical protein BJX64DRAFT_275761 [Aspergillus heterothallicus]